MHRFLQFATVFSVVSLGAVATATVLTSDRVAVGVAPDGSLGDAEAEVGLRFDPDGPGGAPGSGDVITPGRTWEVWSLSFEGHDGTYEFGSPEIDGGLVFSWEREFENDAVHALRGAASADPFEMEMVVALSRSTDVLWLELTLTATEATADLWVARSIDLDLDAAFDSFATENSAGEGFATSASTTEPRAFAMVANGPGTVCTDWCASVDDIRADSAGDEMGDSPIGVAVSLGDLAAGESTTVRFVYALGESSSSARQSAAAALLSLDLDGDGVETAADCEDLDPRVAPGLEELADGFDNDCDGAVDEETTAFDDDADGYTEAEGDCDDDDARVWPGAPPVAGVRDANCDGLADDGWDHDVGPGELDAMDDADAGASDTDPLDSSFGGLVDGGTSLTPTNSSGCASASATRPFGPSFLVLSFACALLLRRKP